MISVDEQGVIYLRGAERGRVIERFWPLVHPKVHVLNVTAGLDSSNIDNVFSLPSYNKIMGNEHKNYTIK